MAPSRRLLHCTCAAVILLSAVIFLSGRHRESLVHAVQKIHSISTDIISSYTDEEDTLDGDSSDNGTSGPSKGSSLDDTLDLPSLLSLCDQTDWTEGLWLHCHSQCGANQSAFCGGLTNARNRIQTCIRLAIDAGAGVIIPPVTTRAEDNLADTNQNEVCPEEWWDIGHLTRIMTRNCPQLRYRFCETSANIEGATIIQAPYRFYKGPAHTPGTFREVVDEALAAHDGEDFTIGPEKQVVVEYGDTYIGWNYAESHEMSTVRKSLFKPLRYNTGVVAYGEAILQSPQLKGGAFIGIHLRGEADWPAFFGSADVQMDRYVNEIQNITETMPDAVSTIYVSCGDRDAIQRFREMLEPFNYTVHDKWTILASQPSKLAEVEALGFDQKGIVEYEVLVKARFWMGIIMSSMSSLVAYARTMDEEKDFFETYVYPDSEQDGLQRVYEDNLAMKGDNYTKLLVVSGDAIMDMFP